MIYISLELPRRNVTHARIELAHLAGHQIRCQVENEAPGFSNREMLQLAFCERAAVAAAHPCYQFLFEN